MTTKPEPVDLEARRTWYQEQITQIRTSGLPAAQRTIEIRRIITKMRRLENETITPGKCDSLAFVPHKSRSASFGKWNHIDP